METTFRWRNWLSVSVFFFLIIGVIKVRLAIVVPATLHLSGSFPGVVFGAGDAQLLGRSFAGRRLQPPVSWLRYTIGDWRPERTLLVNDIPGWMLCHMCLFPDELCW